MKKNKVRLCFEINELGTDENGCPCPTGMQIELGETKKTIDYAVLTKIVNIPGILKHIGLQDVIKPESVRAISPEEYDRRYRN